MLAQAGMLTSALAAAAAVYLGSRAVLPAFIRRLEAWGLTGVNYRGRRVATCGGLLLWGATAAVWAVRLALGDGAMTRFALALALVAASGLIDDRFGDKAVKGFAGHWQALRREGRLTTGWVKAGAVLAGAALCVPYDGRPLPYALRLLTVLLAANAVNLLDLRPGRALKGFLAALATVLGGALTARGALPSGERLVWLAPVVAGAAALAPHDLKGRLMLGDTGANALGFALGCAVVWFAPPLQQGAALLLLAALHAYTWNRSLSRAIERSPLLRWLDRAGRAEG